MPNCPLRKKNTIIDFINEFNKSNFDSLISCFKFGWTNPWWAFKYNDKKQHEWIFNDYIKKRAQDLPSLFCPSGAIWVANSKKLKKNKTFYGSNYSFKTINLIESVDIDDEQDLEFAKNLTTDL